MPGFNVIRRLLPLLAWFWSVSPAYAHYYSFLPDTPEAFANFHCRLMHDALSGKFRSRVWSDRQLITLTEGLGPNGHIHDYGLRKRIWIATRSLPEFAFLAGRRWYAMTREEHLHFTNAVMASLRRAVQLDFQWSPRSMCTLSLVEERRVMARPDAEEPTYFAWLLGEGKGGNGSPVLISYHLRKNPGRMWAIDDIVLEYQSLSRTYRSRLEHWIVLHGLDGMIQELHQYTPPWEAGIP